MQQPKCVFPRRMRGVLCLAASTRSLLSSLHLKVTPPAACLLLFRIDTGVILPPVLPLGDTPPIQQIGFTVSLRQHWNSISKGEHFAQCTYCKRPFCHKTGGGVLGGCMDQYSPFACINIQHKIIFFLIYLSSLRKKNTMHYALNF